VSELEEFHAQFFQDVMIDADAGEQWAEDAFFQQFCDHLIDAGELLTADRAAYYSPRGLRIDGYGGDPVDSDGILTLIVAAFSQSPDIVSLPQGELDLLFKRTLAFLVHSLDPKFRDGFDESAPAFGVADLINARWPSIVKVRLVLITNRKLSARVDGRPAGEFRGIPVTYNVWDIDRLHRFVASGQGHEPIEIDLVKDFGGPLPALPAHLDGAGYEAYLAVVPGKQLAAIYDRWGSRLLEQNVRVFMQGRGANRGIRITIENDPEMFFAYNNGITATAEAVEASRTEDGLLLTKLTNLQIVNGGQTTGSIHAASLKKSIDLSRVHVQMKLSVIEPSEAMEVVPNISRFANTQTKINAADFFSNHPFHVRMEGFSRRLFAPSAEGTFRETKWFYERARGQYADARSRLTPAEKRKYEAEFPRQQVFSKTDLAKYLNLWRGHPDVVSKGAQKNFAHFAQAIAQEWEKSDAPFNDMYFRHAVAKAIVFRTTEKLVSEQPWYEGGYRANVVAYAIAKLAYDCEREGISVNFDRIWLIQNVSRQMKEALTVSSTAVHEVIVNPPAGARNVTEWAKQQACWSRVQALKVSWPASWLDELVSPPKPGDGEAEAQIEVVEAGADAWRRLREWGMREQLLSQTEAGLLALAATIPSRLPNGKQCRTILDIRKRLQKEGFQCDFESSMVV
jgi:hypothetical protein